MISVDGIPYAEALASIKEKRPMAEPNQGFERYLRGLEPGVPVS